MGALIGFTLLCITSYWIRCAFTSDPELKNALRARRRWIRRIPGLLGIDIDVRGEVPQNLAQRPASETPGRPYLYVSNHRSYLDPIVSLVFAEFLMVGKFEVSKWPLIGYAGRITGVIFVEREKLSSRFASLHTIFEQLAAGRSVLNYPEGTTTDEAKTIRFNPGPFVRAAEAGIPIVPIAVEYPDSEDAWVGGDTFVRHFYQTFAKPRVRVAVSFGAPMTDEDGSALMQRVKTWIDAELAESRASFGYREVAGQPLAAGASEV